jgi:ankyrin repeat protein
MIHLLSETSDSKAFGKFKLAVVSREIPDLRGCTQIRLDPDNNEKVIDDIERFVSARVKELKKIEGFTGKVQSHVEQTLLSRAQGTFLWVGFAMHELLQKATCTEVLDTLSKIPRGLFAVYSRLLLQIPEERRETSRQILQWVSTALRPLSLAELASALDVEATSGLMTIEQAIRDKIAFCGPFLKIEGKIVGLVHQSAQDYLLREETDSDPILETFRIKPESAHMDLARTCLDRFVRQGMNDISSHRSSGVFLELDPLLEYANDQVPNHVQKCPTFVSQLSGTIIRIAAFDLEVRDHWAWNLNSSWVTMPALHIACRMGIVTWAQTILTRTIRNPRLRWRLEERTDYLKSTPLFVAVRHKQTTVVKFLVDRGAKVNAQDPRGYTVLHEAVIRKNEELVRLLLDCGASVDVKRDLGQTALYMSFDPWCYNEDIVRLLLQHTTNTNIRTDRGHTVLHRAAWENYEAVARLLLDHGVDLEAKDTDGRTPLHLAAWQGHQNLVQLLLKSGANPATKNDDGETALDMATSDRRTNVIQILKEASIEG